MPLTRFQCWLISIAAMAMVAVSCGSRSQPTRPMSSAATEGSSAVVTPATSVPNESRFDAGVSINDEGDLLLVDTKCSSPTVLGIGMVSVGDAGKVMWLAPRREGRVVVLRSSGEEDEDVVFDPPELDLRELPPSTNLSIGFLDPFEFTLGELSPESVLTPDGVRPISEFLTPCVRGGSEWWGVQLLENGHLEVVSVTCETVLSAGFVVTVDDQPRLTWASGFLEQLMEDDLSSPEEAGKPRGNPPQGLSVELSPETNSESPGPPAEDYGFADLDPAARIQVEAIGGYFVLVQRSDLQPGVVVTGTDSVPRAVADSACGSDGTGTDPEDGVSG